MKLFWTLTLTLLFPTLLPAQAKDCFEPMKQVHARFKGQKGTFAQFGDSITVSLAFWAPLQYGRKGIGAEGEAAFKLVNGHMKKDCWDKWRGPRFGNEGRILLIAVIVVRCCECHFILS